MFLYRYTTDIDRDWGKICCFFSANQPLLVFVKSQHVLAEISSYTEVRHFIREIIWMFVLREKSNWDLNELVFLKEISQGLCFENPVSPLHILLEEPPWPWTVNCCIGIFLFPSVRFGLGLSKNIHEPIGSLREFTRILPEGNLNVLSGPEVSLLSLVLRAWFSFQKTYPDEACPC